MDIGLYHAGRLIGVAASLGVSVYAAVLLLRFGGAGWTRVLAAALVALAIANGVEAVLEASLSPAGPDQSAQAYRVWMVLRSTAPFLHLSLLTLAILVLLHRVLAREVAPR